MMTICKSILVVMSVWMYLLMLVHGGDISSSGSNRQVLANVHLCMMNCGQCKEMYGDYFDGQRCAEFCLASYKTTGPSGAAGWAPMPDCNEPETVDQFLKLSSDGRDLMSSSGYGKPISQALMGSAYASGRQPSAQQQQNTYYNSRGSEYKGVDRGNWKKRITNGKIGSIPRWYFLAK